MGEKHNFLEILRKFEKIFLIKLRKTDYFRIWNFEKNFLRKLRNTDYFCIFFKKFNKPWVYFWRVWTKNLIYWKFWENFRNFRKIFVRKLRKCMILAYFSTDLTNFAVIFRAFGRKSKLWKIFQKFFKLVLRKIA